MEISQSQSYRKMRELIAATGDTYGFDGVSSVEGFGVLLEVIREMGLDPLDSEGFLNGLTGLFRIELINKPDLNTQRSILAPNHVSDFDALIMGLLHPKIRIVSKTDWTDNEKLRRFLDVHYQVYGLDRASLQSLRALLADSVEYFNGSAENRHFLVFSQGTISDINHNSLERISPVAHKISLRTDVPILPVFIEQPSLDHPTRIVFDKPALLSRKDDFREFWLESEKALQA